MTRDVLVNGALEVVDQANALLIMIRYQPIRYLPQFSQVEIYFTFGAYVFLVASLLNRGRRLGYFVTYLLIEPDFLSLGFNQIVDISE